MRYSGGDGYRAKVRAYCILSLHVDSEQEGGWSLVNVTVKERERVGVGGVLSQQFGALFPALLMCTMK